VNGNIAVPAEGYYDVPFSVDADTINGARVKGEFEVTQGTGVELDRIGNTGIEILILDDWVFANWVDGITFIDGVPLQIYIDNELYSDRFFCQGLHSIAPGVVGANIDFKITTPGDYHLVFSNMDSPFISKNVAAEIKFYWFG
jgi:hypothetical protein